MQSRRTKFSLSVNIMIPQHDRLKSSELKKHVHGTYICLRYGICLIGFLLPVILIIGGMALGIPWQESISQYYHTPLGDVFVGSLFGIGAFLYLYKGFSREENIALNIAGLSVVCVALFPTPISDQNLADIRAQICSADSTADRRGHDVVVADAISAPEHRVRAGRQGMNQTQREGEPWSCWLVHVLAALAFFFAIAWACIRCSDDTLHLVAEPRRSQLALRYDRMGVLMIVVPIAAAIAEVFDLGSQYQVIFVVEWAAILVFSSYWWTKSREFKHLLSVPECIVPDQQNESFRESQ